MRVFVCVLAPPKDCMKKKFHYTRGFKPISKNMLPKLPKRNQESSLLLSLLQEITPMDEELSKDGRLYFAFSLTVFHCRADPVQHTGSPTHPRMAI